MESTEVRRGTVYIKRDENMIFVGVATKVSGKYVHGIEIWASNDGDPHSVQMDCVRLLSDVELLVPERTTA